EPNTGWGLVTSGCRVVTNNSLPFSSTTDLISTGTSKGDGLEFPDGLTCSIKLVPTDKFTFEILILFSVPLTLIVWALAKSLARSKKNRNSNVTKVLLGG